MVEMSLKELFEIGQSFESSVGEGTKGERARIFKNNSRLNLTDEMISFIENIDYEVNFLVSGEIWCPDFQLNATVLKRFLDLNTNFNMSVITMARGKKFMAPALGIDKESFKGPSIAVLDKDFNVLGLFEGIQNLLNILTLFFIKLPTINKIIDKIKVEVISKFKECKIPPTLHILTCTYKNILDKL